MNRQSIITILLTIFMSITGVKAFAHDIAVKNIDGKFIYYVWNNNKTELSVTYDGYYYDYYTGNVVIPESVEYKGKTYPVTSIGQRAFNDCTGLTSVTIPNSVISIVNEAFYEIHWQACFFVLQRPDLCHHRQQRGIHRRGCFRSLQQPDLCDYIL